MIDSLRWLIAVELIAVAALPLTVWLWRALPDRGYAFARILGLVAVTYVAWLIGSVLPLGGTALLPVVGILIGLASWVIWGRATLARLSEARRAVMVEELVFLAAFVLWNLLRALVIHPGIDHTEQFMDMAFLNAAHRSITYPPYDPWMSGHTINYYYFGYLIWGTVVNLSGVAPAVGYNLALSTLFALTISGAFSLGYALTRRLMWAGLAPFLIGLIGNWHAIATQIPAGQFPWNQDYWFWGSTRVIASAADYTINEFPYFSFLLGDMHPHVMALPITLAAIALAFAWFAELPGESWSGWGRLLAGALLVGSLFATNSWDFPTYLLLTAAALLAARYVQSEQPRWWVPASRQIIVLAAAAVILFLPSYLEVRGLTHGIGLVTTRSDIGQFVQVFGLFLAGAALLVGAVGYVFQPADAGAESGSVSLRWASVSGIAATIALVVAIVAGLALGAEIQAAPLLIDLALASGAGLVLWRVLNSDDPRQGDVIALLGVLLAALILASTEIVYIRDTFDGSAMYRMNTVFKFYYQVWVLLGLATAYGLWRASTIIRRYGSVMASRATLAVFALGILGGLGYSVLAPLSPTAADTTIGLNGMGWLQSGSPGDAQGINWLDSHVHGNPVVLEAIRNASSNVPVDYSSFSRVSTFSGLPTIMGWPGHEEQWRPGDPDIATRVQDVVTMYATRNVTLAKALLRRYQVRYVFVGSLERTLPGVSAASLSKFARFMHLVFHSGGTDIYTW